MVVRPADPNVTTLPPPGDWRDEPAAGLWPVAPGGTVAGYRLIEPVGRGGMGEVWRAEQHRPRRAVALKLIRGDLLGPETRRRFEREAEALGRLNHDGVAKVYEAGLDPATGRPFCAMEFVDGLPLDEWAARKRPPREARLRLLIDLCRAVQHAHQKGVIHRDLKPANVLVTAEGRPKVLDFGLARLLDPDDPGPAGDSGRLTRQTEAGRVLGSLAYMAPEQAAGDAAEVDALSDVYALGVIAYELLGGRLPIDVAGVPLPRATRLIADAQPRPLGRLDRALRGDLDTIVSKAMAKEKPRRYESAAGMAEDVRRHLEYEPIAARRPGALYHAGRFARRHTAVVVGAAAVLGVLGVGATSTGVYALKADRQARVALAALSRARAAEAAAVEQRDEARRQGAVAEAAGDFLAGLLAAADPAHARGDPATVGEVLATAARELDARYADEPLVKSALQVRLAIVLNSNGRRAEAEALTRDALATRRRLLGHDDPRTLLAAANLAAVLRGRGELAEAEALAREAHAGRRRVLGEGDPETLVAAEVLASVLAAAGRPAEAEPLARRARDGLRDRFGEDDPRALDAANDLAGVLNALGRAGEAEPIYARVLAVRRDRLPAGHPALLASLNNLAAARHARRDYAAAVPLYREALDAARVVLGESHPQTLSTLCNLATAIDAGGDPEAAEPLAREAVARLGESLGATHPATLTALNNLAGMLHRQGRPAEAEPLYRRALLVRRLTLGADHPDVLASTNNLAACLRDRGDAAGAEPLFAAALAAAEAHASLGPSHPMTRRFARNHAACLDALGRADEAAAVRGRFAGSEESE